MPLSKEYGIAAGWPRGGGQIVVTAPVTPPASNWILATGSWSDTGVWDDVELWKDS